MNGFHRSSGRAQVRRGCGTLLASVVLLLGAAQQAKANVYAAHLAASPTTGDISPASPMTIEYRLNQAATSVTIEIYRASTPSTVIKTIAGTTTYGLNTVTWDGTDDSSNPASGASDYKFRLIAADSVGKSSWTNITPKPDGTNEIGDAQFYAPQGVAINRDPASQHFGRIYICSGESTLTSSKPGATAVGDGLFLLNNDMTFRGGSAATAAATANSQLACSSTSNQSPWKCAINQSNSNDILVADSVSGYEDAYIFNADGTTVNRVLNRTTTGPTTGAAYNHGRAYSGTLSGTGSSRRLWTLDRDKEGGTVTNLPDLLRYNIGNTLVDYTAMPAEAKNGGSITGSSPYHPPTGVTNMYTARDVKFGRASTTRVYVACRRDNALSGNLAAVCYTLNSTGNVSGFVWSIENDHLIAYTGASWNQTAAIAVDDARNRVAIARDGGAYTATGYAQVPANARVVILDISADAITANNGKPGYVTYFDSSSNAASIRSMDFDAAGNLYTTNQSDEHVRMWSPADGPNSYTTTYLSTLTVNCTGQPAPVITEQPASVNVCPGDPVTLTVTADPNGGPPIAYTWKKSSTVVGTNSPTYTIPAAATSDAGNYTCTVTGCSSVVSSTATVRVGATITGQPVAQSHMCQGGTATFTVTAVTGAPPLTYQWYKNGTIALTDGNDGAGVIISGATGPTLTLTNLNLADNNAAYSCKVSDQCASPVTVTSSAPKLTFDIPTISVQPVSVGVYHGQTATFSVTAADPLAGSLNYQWRKNSINIPGANASTLTMVGDYAEAGADIDVVVSNTCGYTVSSAVNLNVVTLPCNRSWADADRDLDVDMDDFGSFQACYSGTGLTDLGACHCYDRGGTASMVDNTDAGAFIACVTGPMVPASTVCGATVLFSDNFDTTASAGNWVAAANTTDYTVVTSYNYGAQSIPSAPNSIGGTTKGLKVNVNLATGTGTTLLAAVAYGSASAPTFTNDYTVRFDMYMRWGASDAGTSTMAVFGVDGDGTSIQAPTLGDASTGGASPVLSGYLYAAGADGQLANRDFRAYDGASELLPVAAGWTGGSGLGSDLPFSALFPSPRAYDVGAAGNSPTTGWGWIAVEIIHSTGNNAVSLKLNDTLVGVHPLSTASSGKLMLGMFDTYTGSKMGTGQYVVFDNVLVTTP